MAWVSRTGTLLFSKTPGRRTSTGTVLLGCAVFGLHTYSNSGRAAPDPLGDHPRYLVAADDAAAANGGGCDPPLGMFDMVDAAVSFKVVNCFLGIAVFQLVCEHILEVLEDVAHGTVYASVLHRTYRELMLLGFVAFIIFFIVTDPSITDNFVASFEYADFVMFFVGMSFICQSVWTCIANYAVKTFSFMACNLPTPDLVESYKLELESVTGCLKWISFNHAAVRTQIFRHIFLSVYDLPDAFSFPHYFGVSLDALTADLVELLPGSYIALMLLIAFCEYIVRHHGYTYNEFRHPTTREPIDEITSVLLYGLIGLLIFLTYLYLLRLCTRASTAIIAFHFEKQMTDVSLSEHERLNAALESTTVNGGFRLSRSFAKVQLDLVPFMVENRSAHGAEELGEMARKRKELVAARKSAARTSKRGLYSKERAASLRYAPGGPGNDGSFDAVVERHGSLGGGGDYGDELDEHGRGVSANSVRGASGARGTSKGRLHDRGLSIKTVGRRGSALASKQAAAVAAKAVQSASRAAHEVGHLHIKTREERESDQRDLKRRRAAHRMAKHSSRVNPSHRHHGIKMYEELSKDGTWINQETERINEVVRMQLPGQSIKGVRRFIDAMRLISNFYISIFVCTFITGSHIAENMGTLTRVGNLLGLGLVILANTVLDPLVTFEYANLRTMGVINPLLVGETVEHVATLDRLLEQMALKVLNHWREAVDPDFAEEAFVPSTASLREMIKVAFEDWDTKDVGFLTPESFGRAMDAEGLILPKASIKMLFDRIDCFQFNGEISLEEMTTCLAPVINKVVGELQGTIVLLETTNNLDDAMAQARGHRFLINSRTP